MGKLWPGRHWHWGATCLFILPLPCPGVWARGVGAQGPGEQVEEGHTQDKQRTRPGRMKLPKAAWRRQRGRSEESQAAVEPPHHSCSDVSEHLPWARECAGKATGTREGSWAKVILPSPCSPLSGSRPSTHLPMWIPVAHLRVCLSQLHTQPTGANLRRETTGHKHRALPCFVPGRHYQSITALSPAEPFSGLKTLPSRHDQLIGCGRQGR